jgi:hypothetical protein
MRIGEIAQARVRCGYQKDPGATAGEGWKVGKYLVYRLYREEGLTVNEAKEMIELWRREYNQSHPHRALGERTPNEFASQAATSRDLSGPQGAENSLWKWYKNPRPFK